MDLYNLSMGIGSFMMQAWKALVIFMLKWLVSNKGTVFQRKLFQLEMEASDSVSWLHSKSEQFTSASTWEAITFKQPVVPWWRLILDWCFVEQPVHCWSEVIQWCASDLKGGRLKVKLCKLALSAVYALYGCEETSSSS
uniref:Reverse transcriptase zinc-binding domain-containing protein n=1 Tax=Fagus sylvatica TaxID=28930 RepID=A0A2N9J625_FAGSY